MEQTYGLCSAQRKSTPMPAKLLHGTIDDIEKPRVHTHTHKKNEKNKQKNKFRKSKNHFIGSCMVRQVNIPFHSFCQHYSNNLNIRPPNTGII